MMTGSTRAQRKWQRVLLLPLLALFLGATIVACEDDDDIEVGAGTATETPMATETATAAATETATMAPGVQGGGDISSLEDAELGDTVEFSGDLGEVLGVNSFTVEGGDLDTERLVLLPSNVSLPADMVDADGEGQVEVVGTVVEVVVADLETDLGVDFDEDETAALDNFAAERAIVASFVEYVSEEPDADVEEGEVGEVVTANGEIGEIYSQRLFTVSGDEILGIFGGADTLAIIPSDVRAPLEEMAEGARVEVTGTVVEIIVADIEGEYFADEPFTGEEDTAFEDFEDDFGIVVEEITVIEP